MYRAASRISSIVRGAWHGCLLDAYGTNYLSPVPQRDAVEVGKILRRLGYVKDKHQLLKNGKKLKRMWRRVDASSASTVSQPPEAGQTPTGGSEDSNSPHVSSSLIESEQIQEEEQIIATALLGKTPEAPEALSVGSSFDVPNHRHRGLINNDERADSWDAWD